MKYTAVLIDGKTFTGLEDAPLTKVKDTESGKIETVVGVHGNSHLITQQARNKNGVDCTQWFDMTNKFHSSRFISQ